MALPNVVIGDIVGISRVGPHCGRGHSKGVNSRAVKPVVKGYVKGFGWLLWRVVRPICVILIKRCIIRVWPVIVWIWLLIVWFWLFIIWKRLFVIWRWLHVRIFILFWWRIGLFIVFHWRIV